jgi:isoquinoline 1-oxidoreductase subunit beta
MNTLIAPLDAVSRRRFIQTLGAGLLIAIADLPADGQVETGAPAAAGRRGGRGGFGGGPVSISARVHIGRDGTITVMTGKVECGQGARAEITQAAAEELCVAPEQIHLIMADTSLTPDDGPSYGSQTTPNSVPRIRRGVAAARQALVAAACGKWGVPVAQAVVSDGKIMHAASGNSLGYSDLVGDDSNHFFGQAPVGGGVTLTPVGEWKVMGTSVARPDRVDMVTGGHRYPSDIVRPGMLYGRVLRAPAYQARLTKIDLSAAKAMKDVIAVQDGDFVGVAAPTNFAATQAIAEIAKTAVWEKTPQIGNGELFASLLRNAQGGVPGNPYAADLAAAPKSLKREYQVNYIQHAPLEPRAAVAEWQDGKLTVWTGSQNPFGVRTQLQEAFGLSGADARVIIPDFGGAFGGKHTGEAALEAARLAKAAGKPVWIRWTRQDEFTWAYFRPAGVILNEAALDAKGALANWYHVNINSGPSGVGTPYSVRNFCQAVRSQEPLRQGSYRGLAISANNFARECFMDEMAELAGADPLSFRLAHLTDPRLRAVLQSAADTFRFADQFKNRHPNVGVGIACGTEKGSFLATCALVEIDPSTKEIAVRKVVEAFDCGAIVNPAGLLSQVQGAIVQGLGGALREAVQFDNGTVTSASFADYLVPRFVDVPELEVQLIDRKDVASAGAGETPIMAIAPAVANAVWHATGQRIHEMPVRLS